MGITYDQIGNPLNDGEWTYTWQNGRQLASMTNGEITASFIYNENGLRVQKTVNGVVTKYTLHGKNIVHMTQGSNELHFFYDAQNKPAIVVYNGVPYSYVKNLQGDIVAILDSNKNIVVSYVYDAWGRPISCSGTMASTLGKINPFRYRGYVYDEETGLYYLRSRHDFDFHKLSPETGVANPIEWFNDEFGYKPQEAGDLNDYSWESSGTLQLLIGPGVFDLYSQ